MNQMVLHKQQVQIAAALLHIRVKQSVCGAQADHLMAKLFDLVTKMVLRMRIGIH
nr:hypothetical protein [Paenibacillus whitsoniae]